jgi:hypothetical protein
VEEQLPVTIVLPPDRASQGVDTFVQRVILPGDAVGGEHYVFAERHDAEFGKCSSIWSFALEGFNNLLLIVRGAVTCECNELIRKQSAKFVPRSAHVGHQKLLLKLPNVVTQQRGWFHWLRPSSY